VGGLADSVTHLNGEPSSINAATGFVFSDYSRDVFAQTVERAVETFRNKSTWDRLIQNGMAQDWSWNRSASRYVEVYQRAQGRISARATENRR
jgi:starch synthase